jgi:hypothetical protein
MAMWFCGVLVLWFSLIVDELVLDIGEVWFYLLKFWFGATLKVHVVEFEFRSWFGALTILLDWYLNLGIKMELGCFD